MNIFDENLYFGHHDRNSCLSYISMKVGVGNSWSLAEYPNFYEWVNFIYVYKYGSFLIADRCNTLQDKSHDEVGRPVGTRLEYLQTVGPWFSNCGPIGRNWKSHKSEINPQQEKVKSYSVRGNLRVQERKITC